jgi:predicted ribosomally synthesized peptide with SipW-like signal peptide
MSNDTQFSISRRKVLAGLGTIGIASAGAGLGTTAFFSDDETVEASLEAGRLDLLVDFRATYDTWLDQAATDDIVDGPALADPSEGTEMRYVVGQAPDWRDADGAALTGTEWGALTKRVDACRFDTPTNIQSAVASGEISGINTEMIDGTVEDTEDSFYPGYIDGMDGMLFSLNDVKPKDGGEATVSLHLCDNPAYLWTELFVTENSENGAVEPETSAGDDAGSAIGELADYLHVTVFDDADCENDLDRRKADVAVVFDLSGSMNSPSSKLQAAKAAASQFVDAVNGSSLDALITFAGDADIDIPLTDDVTAADIGSLSAGGSTNISDGLLAAYAELTGSDVTLERSSVTPSGNDRDDADKVIVLLGDGAPKVDRSDSRQTVKAVVEGLKNGTTGSFAGGRSIDTAEAAIDSLYTIAYSLDPNAPNPLTADQVLELFRDIAFVDGTYVDGDPATTGGNNDGTNAAQATANLSEDLDPAVQAAYPAGFGDDTTENQTVERAFRLIARAIRGDIILYEGTLGGLIADPTLSGAVPLDSLQIQDCVLNDPADVTAYAPGVHCVAFEWYLPCDAAEIRALDLGSCYDDLAEDPDATMLDELVQREIIADEDDFDVNVVQTDKLTFGARFAAVQTRHNMDNSNPFDSPA